MRRETLFQEAEVFRLTRAVWRRIADTTVPTRIAITVRTYLCAGFTLSHRSDGTKNPGVYDTCQNYGFKAFFGRQHSGLSPHLSFFDVDKGLFQPVKLSYQLSVKCGSGSDVCKPDALRFFDKLLEGCIEG